MDQWMTEDDEVSGKQITEHLAQLGMYAAPSSVSHLRISLGWTVHYYQLIRDVNKTKRLHWGQDHQSNFLHDIIWNDKSSIQLQTHKRFVVETRMRR